MSGLLSTIQRLVSVGKVRASPTALNSLPKMIFLFGEFLASLPHAKWIEEYREYHKGLCVLVLQTTEARELVRVLWGLAGKLA